MLTVTVPQTAQATIQIPTVSPASAHKQHHHHRYHNLLDIQPLFHPYHSPKSGSSSLPDRTYRRRSIIPALSDQTAHSLPLNNNSPGFITTNTHAGREVPQYPFANIATTAQLVEGNRIENKKENMRPPQIRINSGRRPSGSRSAGYKSAGLPRSFGPASASSSPFVLFRARRTTWALAVSLSTTLFVAVLITCGWLLHQQQQPSFTLVVPAGPQSQQIPPSDHGVAMHSRQNQEENMPVDLEEEAGAGAGVGAGDDQYIIDPKRTHKSKKSVPGRFRPHRSAQVASDEPMRHSGVSDDVQQHKDDQKPDSSPAHLIKNKKPSSRRGSSQLSSESEHFANSEEGNENYVKHQGEHQGEPDPSIVLQQQNQHRKLLMAKNPRPEPPKPLPVVPKFLAKGEEKDESVRNGPSPSENDKEQPDTPVDTKPPVSPGTPASPVAPPFALTAEENLAAARESFSDFAVAVKTGRDIAVERVPIQLLTFLKKVKNLVVIGEAPGVIIGNIPLVDIYTGLYDDDYTPAPPPKIKDSPEDLDAIKNRKIQEAVIPDKNNRGWRLDAHKNLPGFRYLYQTFPNAKWYIMIDDDTYVMLNNLKNFLSAYNPLDEYYFGAPNVFSGCDGVKKFGDGPLFAHGGSGIVISRGAMLKMMGTIGKCINKYRDCWAGDVRTALCLRDIGVLLKGQRGFNGDPPGVFGNMWWPRNPCDRPFTFHHLLSRQMQRIHDIESNAGGSDGSKGAAAGNGNLLTYGALLAALDEELGLGGYEKDYNRSGHDYNVVEIEGGHEGCYRMCKNDPRCVAWTYDLDKCWLKDFLSARKEKQGAVSGIIPEHYRCDA